jgi:hypothetical protein
MNCLMRLETIRIVYHYENKTGERLQRSFSLQDIRDGVDKSHIKLIPGYKFIGCEVEILT